MFGARLSGFTGRSDAETFSRFLKSLPQRGLEG
jgi:hypothetical protein